MNRHYRALTEGDEKTKSKKRLIRKNSRIRHFQIVTAQQNKIHNEVERLTMRAISTKTVANLTPFAENKNRSIQNNLFTEDVEPQTKAIILSSYQSSELHSQGTQKHKPVFERLLRIINTDTNRHVKKRQVRCNMKTTEDVLAQKYLLQCKEAKLDQRKFKSHIVDKMNKTMRSNNNSMFELEHPSFNILSSRNNKSQKLSQQVSTTQTTFNIKTKRTSNHYKVKKAAVIQKYFDDEGKLIGRSYSPSDFTYVDYLSNKKMKQQFLDSHRTVKKYCAELIRNEDKILAMAKYGTKNYDTLKRCLDSALNSYI